MLIDEDRLVVSNTGLVFTPIGLLCSGLPVWTGTIISQHNALAAYEDVIGVPTRIISILDEQMFFTHWLISIEGFTSWRIYEFRSTMNNGMPKQPHLGLQSHVFLFLSILCIYVYLYITIITPKQLIHRNWRVSSWLGPLVRDEPNPLGNPREFRRCHQISMIPTD